MYRLLTLGLLLTSALMIAPPAAAEASDCVKMFTELDAWCDVSFVVEDLDGRPYGVEAGVWGKVTVCTNSGCAPWVPDCYYAKVYLGGEGTGPRTCLPLPFVESRA